jgi:very-short-patch-repair endonuclease
VLDTIDRAIAAIADTQHGLITYVQLLALGLSDGGIRYRVATGRLYRVHQGLYSVGHRPISPHSRAMAAVLACGPDAALSHGSAATLWGIGNHWDTPIEVTARSARRRPGIRTHRSKTLTALDVTEHYGIRVTTPARTLLDNANRLSYDALAGGVSTLRLAGYLTRGSLDELLARHPPTRATERLRRHTVHPKRGPTRSKFERDFLSLAERHRLPEPEVNTKVAGYEVDIFFPDHALTVELDAYETHSDPAQFEKDRNRDADLAAIGIATVRITDERFYCRPDQEAVRLEKILKARMSSR